jgi:hypothetical protein
VPRGQTGLLLVLLSHPTSKAKWRLTAVPDFTPKELGKPYAAQSEVSKMSMKSVFLQVGVRLPQLLEGENAVAFEDRRQGEEKKDLVEGAVTGRPRCQCMSRQDTLDPLIAMGDHPLSRQTDPHPSPLSTCLMRPRCAAVACETIVFTWPAGAQISVGPNRKEQDTTSRQFLIKYGTVQYSTCTGT